MTGEIIMIEKTFEYWDKVNSRLVEYRCNVYDDVAIVVSIFESPIFQESKEKAKENLSPVLDMQNKWFGKWFLENLLKCFDK